MTRFWLRTARCSAMGTLLLACGAEREGAPGTPRAAAEVGFVEVPADTYELSGTMLTSAPARLFYDYQPATRDAEGAPLVVVTGGGPGAAAFLLAMDTAPNGVTVGEDGSLTVGALDATWGDLANLLYIDARDAGYSYAITAVPADDAERAAGFSAAAYNVYRDAADVTEVLLAFLGQHRELVGRDLYFAAESYGGARTAVLVDILLHPGDYASDGRPLRSPTLAAALTTPLVGATGAAVLPAEVGARLRGQVLLQPIIAGALQDAVAGELFEQPGSLFDELAATVGVPFVRCAERPAPCEPFGNAQVWLVVVGRSLYDYRAPVTWLDELLARGEAAGEDATGAAAALGVSEGDLLTTLAERDAGAYRFVAAAAPEEGTLAQSLPPLPAWDAYFTPLDRDVLEAFHAPAVLALDADPDASLLPSLFVSNLRSVPTLVTRAGYDLLVYAPALPGVLQRMPGVASVTAGAGDALVVTLDDGTLREVCAPRFAESSHAIASDEPAALHDALASFLAATASGSP